MSIFDKEGYLNNGFFIPSLIYNSGSSVEVGKIYDFTPSEKEKPLLIYQLSSGTSPIDSQSSEFTIAEASQYKQHFLAKDYDYFPPPVDKSPTESLRESVRLQRNLMPAETIFLPYSSRRFQTQIIESNFCYRGIVVPLKRGVFPFLTINYEIESVRLDPEFLFKRLQIPRPDATETERRVVIGLVPDFYQDKPLQLLDFNLNKFSNSTFISLGTNEEEGTIDFRQLLFKKVIITFAYHEGFYIDNPTVILEKPEDREPIHFKRGEEHVIPSYCLNLSMESEIKKRGTFWTVEKKG